MFDLTTNALLVVEESLNYTSRRKVYNVNGHAISNRISTDEFRVYLNHQITQPWKTLNVKVRVTLRND